ncbi:FecCD family ABC transporter permease [Actinokineospora iranica]|uniref:Iron complex transport system permease protein n=1 Tax=Actinokineospora iranica TaxID=1271860 RepID=A0A1G6U8H3_9PSEU|nr:iron chelate uptake ABC transporter family permease subunit [Actinokineospora iranica]SDD36996.1 iron complex transport system permease protein [Actinokineospora iranica]
MVVLAATCLASVLIGNETIALGDVLATWRRPDGSDAQRIVAFLRVPRTLVGLLAGAALGLAGALMQGLTRNPLAGPEVLAVNAGAALAVVAAIAGLGLTTLGGYIWFAFLGAAVAGALVYFLAAAGHGGPTPVKLALAGAALTATLAGLTTAVTLLDVSTFTVYRFWSVGALTSAEMSSIGVAALFVAAGAALAIGSTRTLNGLALGEDVARSLGQRIIAGKLVAVAAAVLLAGSAVALAGPIAFVGLTVPHMARAFGGTDYRWILPWSAVLAPIVLLAADILGRLLARPQELQVGIVTAVIGAPVFIALVRGRRLARL